MAELDTTRRNVLKLPTAARLPPIPDIEPPQELSNYQSSVGNSSKCQRKHAADKEYLTQKWYAGHDKGCFLTGVTDHALQLAHLIDTVRDGKDTAEIKWKKSKVEYYMVEQLKIVHPGFNLDEPTNTIYLQPSLHMHLDYGTWAITGSRETLQALIKLFGAVNNYWQYDVTRTGPQAERLHVIPELYRGFPAVQFDIVLLHPNLFLPLGRSLEIRDDFHGHTSGTLRQPPSYSAWAVVDKELRKRSPSYSSTVPPGPRPPFQFISHRPADSVPNIFLFVLNAAEKFIYHKRKYGTGTVSERGRELMELTIRLTEEIYFRPTYDGEEVPIVFKDQWSVPFGENRSDGGGFSSEFEEDGNSEDLADDDDMLLSLGEMDQIMDKLEDENMSVSDRMLYGNLLLFGGRGPRSMPAVPEIDAPQPKLFPSRPPSPRSPRF